MRNDPAYIARFVARLARASVACETWSYARPAAGGETCAWRLTPKAPRGLVVFAHATGNDALFPQLGLFAALVTRGFEIVAFDLDGHGRASSTMLSADSAVTAVAAAVEQAVARTGQGTPHLVGQSLGGSLLLDAVAVRGVAAQSLTLLSAPVALAPKAADLLAEMTSLVRMGLWRQIKHYGPYGLIPALGPLKRQTYPVRLREAGDYVAAVTALVNGLGLLEVAAAVRVPTLLIYGTRDVIVPLAQGRTLTERIKGAQLAAVKGGTHFTTPFEPGVEALTCSFIEELT